MSGVGTRVTTDTKTYAEQVRRVTRNVQTDLLQIANLYRQISETEALEYIADFRTLMNERYLDQMEFRWMSIGTTTVVDAFRYKVINDEARALDRPGGITYDSALARARFEVTINYSAQWRSIDESEQRAVKKNLKVSWGPTDVGNYAGGGFVADRVYGQTEVGLDRDRFRKR